MYYIRKLSCCNLTIYEAVPPNSAHCYTWHEVNGKLDSLEIGTCLYMFLTTLAENIKEVSLFCDTCGSQNRNQNIAALCMCLVQKTHIESIEKKFLKSGNIMMECDSMHSAIESRKNTYQSTLYMTGRTSSRQFAPLGRGRILIFCIGT